MGSDFNSVVVPEDMCSWYQQKLKTLMVDALRLIELFGAYLVSEVLQQELQGECMELHVACKDNPFLLRGSVEDCNKKQ